MPVGGQSHDFLLSGNGRRAGFMLLRNPPGGGRAWTRTGQPDSPARRSPQDTKYGNLPDEVDHPEVFNDWSGGFGDAYRQPGRENVYHWGENIDARWPGQLVHCQNLQRLVSAQGSPPIDLTLNIDHLNCDFISTEPISQSPTGIPRSGGGSVILIGKNFKSVLTPVAAASFYDQNFTAVLPNKDYGHRPALWGSYVYLASLDNSTARLEPLNNGGSAVGPPRSNGFATAGQRLWRYFGDNRIYSYLQSIASYDATAAASTGNWSATLAVGNGRVGINDMVSINEQLVLGTYEGLFVGDQSGSFYNVMADLKAQSHADNCRDIAVHEGGAVVGHVAGIFRWEPSQQGGYRGVVQEIGPSLLSNRSPVRGFARTVTAYGPWAYAGVWTGSRSYVIAGRRGENQEYVWHTLQKLPDVARVHRLHIDGITANSAGEAIPARMWVATDASIPTGGTAPTYFWPVPLLNGNPLDADPAFSANYIGSARIDFPATNWQAPVTPKLPRVVEVWADLLASGARYADVYYTVDGGTRTLLGRAASSPLSLLYFPTETTGSYVQGQSIALSVESFSASANLTPIYRSFVLRGLLNPRSIDQITAVVRAADGVPNRMGAPDRPAASILADLRAFAAGPPCVLTDTTGALVTVKVQQPVTEVEVYQAGQDIPEIAATVKMVVTTFSGA